MKIAVIILDGAGDHPVPELGGRTPLEAAYIPHISFLAQRGTTFLVDAVFDDLPVGSIVAAIAILGLDPHRYFPNGRASFEAAASGIYVGPQDLAFRCNLISVQDGRIHDFTAGLIDDAKARSLVLAYPQPGGPIELFPGQSYRNTLVYRNAGVAAKSFLCAPPHEHRNQAINEHWIKARTSDATPIVDELNSFLRKSAELIPRLSAEFGTQADMFWLWDPSDAPTMPSFRSVFGVRGAVVSGLSFLRGIGIAMQMLTAEVPGATGYLDSNLRGKVDAGMAFLDDVDVVVIHVNAADEEAHQRHVAGKVKAIELADAHVVGPVVQHLRSRFGDRFQVAVLPDHYTCVADGRHIVHPVPCALYGKGIPTDDAMTFSEREIAARGSGRLKGWELLPMLQERHRNE